jgi:hypothetical protein
MRIAFFVTENNDKSLLSGYNTMSEQERQKFDIKSYIAYFKNSTFSWEYHYNWFDFILFYKP